MDLFGEPEAPEDDDDEIGYAIEEPEEAFAHPRLMNGAKGHEAIESHLLGLFKNDRLPHGLIFTGPKGIGKSTFAYALARFLLKYGQVDPNQDSLFGDVPAIPDCLSMSTEDRTFRLVASAGHPDLLTIERAYDEGKNKFATGVAVADIRKVAPFLRMTSSEGGWRVVIIDDADTMNRSAQNALLKILEEPPKHTLIILIAHRAGALIPTIKSRTQTLNFNPSPQNVFQELLQGQVQDMETLYAFSRGSIGSALELIEHDALELLPRLLETLAQRPHWNWVEIHKLGDELAKSGKDERYQNFKTLLLWLLSQTVTAKARGRDIQPAALGVPSLQTLMQQSSLEDLLEICDKLGEHFLQVERANLDKKQAVLRAFSILAA